jgi:hypothetical protein
MDQSLSDTHEAEFCQLQAQHFSELAESASNVSECSYYRELEEIWLYRAQSQRIRSVPRLRENGSTA